ncbi:hypothetical protein B0919_23525 [Hymenobacter sp. CRA2]|nr:hypothetical protein B0919_23525 [Hymenobacter sp. CRA2]
MLVLLAVGGCSGQEEYTALQGPQKRLVYAMLFRHTFSVQAAVTELAEDDQIEQLIPTERVGCGAWTPLAYAAYIGNVGAVRQLLKHGANVQFRDQLGQTPLILACQAGNTDVMRELLKAGAHVYDTDADDMSTLSHAATAGNREAVRFLLGHGFHPDSSREHMNATDFARFYEQPEIKQLLEEQGLEGNRYKK